MANIVVIDEEIPLQRMTKVVLEKAGHTVHTFSTGTEALRYLQSEVDQSLSNKKKSNENCDLVVLEILLQDVDGLQILKSLKQNPDLQKIPVILLTAISQETVVVKGIQLGAKDYLKKPFHPQELLERVHKLLNPLANMT
jgi:DNA-binding response OmpR family regulator